MSSYILVKVFCPDGFPDDDHAVYEEFVDSVTGDWDMALVGKDDPEN